VEVVDAVNAVFGTHAGFRALHARGALCAGTFRPAPGASAFCAAPLLAQESVPALVRFSNASGNPDDHDGVRDARGMAVKLDDGAWEIPSVTAPSFLTRTPEDFVELLRLRASGDAEALGAWLADHPETGTAVAARFAVGPPDSWLGLVYNGIHAFRFVSPEGEGRWARTRFVPDTPGVEVPDDEAAARDPHYLDETLDAGLPSGFTLIARLAEDGDPLTDPTAPWPEERERVELGRLELERRDEHPEPVVFDPLHLPEGIEPSDDPILQFRPGAYSVSIERRTA
jgi:catalase